MVWLLATSIHYCSQLIDFSGRAESPEVAGGQKRKAPHHFAELFTPPLGKKAKKSSGGPQLPKNACVALNEYKPGLEYVLVEQRGENCSPVHKSFHIHHASLLELHTDTGTGTFNSFNPLLLFCYILFIVKLPVA
jgi:hypothetical protein